MHVKFSGRMLVAAAGLWAASAGTLRAEADAKAPVALQDRPPATLFGPQPPLQLGPMLGRAQVESLKNALTASTGRIKIIASGSEWQSRGTEDGWMSFMR